MLKGIPVIGANLSLIWAYLFVVITDASVAGYGVDTEILSMGDFGSDVALAIIILAFGQSKMQQFLL